MEMWEVHKESYKNLIVARLNQLAKDNHCENLHNFIVDKIGANDITILCYNFAVFVLNYLIEVQDKGFVDGSFTFSWGFLPTDDMVDQGLPKVIFLWDSGIQIINRKEQINFEICGNFGPSGEEPFVSVKSDLKHIDRIWFKIC